MNLWKFDGRNVRVKIITTEGKEYIGSVNVVCDGEEFDTDEDSIGVDCESGPYMFFESNIKEITEISK